MILVELLVNAIGWLWGANERLDESNPLRESRHAHETLRLHRWLFGGAIAIVLFIAALVALAGVT